MICRHRSYFTHQSRDLIVLRPLHWSLDLHIAQTSIICGFPFHSHDLKAKAGALFRFPGNEVRLTFTVMTVRTIKYVIISYTVYLHAITKCLLTYYARNYSGTDFTVV